MVTGDAPATASIVASAVGLQGAECPPGPLPDTLKPEDFGVFASILPEGNSSSSRHFKRAGMRSGCAVMVPHQKGPKPRAHLPPGTSQRGHRHRPARAPQATNEHSRTILMGKSAMKLCLGQNDRRLTDRAKLLNRTRPAPASPRVPGEVVLRQCALAHSRTDERLQKWSNCGCYVFVNPASAHVSSVAELLVRCCSKCVSPDPSALPPATPGRSSSEFLSFVHAWLLQGCSQKTDHT